jgi:hypothetical protein
VYFPGTGKLWAPRLSRFAVSQDTKDLEICCCSRRLLQPTDQCHYNVDILGAFVYLASIEKTGNRPRGRLCGELSGRE